MNDTYSLAKWFSFIFFAALLFVNPLGARSAEAKAGKIKRPNIILIVTDNQSERLLGAYGNTHIKTPHIDQLAAEGSLVANAFAASGVCSPTRAALLTGLMPSQTGIHVALPPVVDLENWSAIEEFRNLPSALSAAGYVTGLVGKYHLGNHYKPQIGFDHWVTFHGGHTTTFWDQEVVDNGETYRMQGHLTDFWTDKAIEFVRDQTDKKPFFLMLAYNGPYMLPPTVLMEPRGKHAAYYSKNIPPMPQTPIHPYLESWARGKGPTGQMVKDGTTAWRAIRALNNPIAMINTAAEMSLLDDGIGRLVASLKAQGLDEDTLIVFTSDQGSSYGQHGLWGNTSWSFPFAAYNMNMRVPLIVRYPRLIAAGQTTDRIVNQVDIFPTILDYANVADKNIPNSSGKSIVSILEGKNTDWDDVAFFEFVTVRVIETPKWKYSKSYHDDVTAELYDLEADPEELNNLIAVSEHTKIIEQLDQQLDAYFTKYSDSKYDLWRGGTAKAQLLGNHYGKDYIFSDRFPDWKTPKVEKLSPYVEK